MATTLIAVVIALIVSHALPDLARLRRYDWLHASAAWIQARISAQAPLVLALCVLPPVVLLALLDWALHGEFFGLGALALSIVVLYLTWGPRDLDLDVEALDSMPDDDRRRAALAGLGLPTGGALAPTAVVDAMFIAALRRWFGLLFWFALLGPAGALGYRLVDLLGDAQAPESSGPSDLRAAAQRLAGWLNWAPAQLMTLGLAIAADFDAVARAWRDVHAARGHWLVLDLGFLIAAARASVDADSELGADAGSLRSSRAEMGESMSLIWRVLTVWGILFALLVLVGLIG